MELILTLLIALSSGAFVALLVIGIAQRREARRLAARERVEAHLGDMDDPRAWQQRAEDLLKERESRSSIEPMDSMLRRSTWADRQALDLARGNVHLRVGEWVLIRLLLGATLGLIAFMANGALLAIPMTFIGYFAPRVWLGTRQAARLKAFNNQLVDMLSLLANSLKVGYGLGQAIDNTAKELSSPMSDELNKVTREINLGVNPETALSNFMHRMHSYDLELIVTSMLIQRRTGGNLAEVLENIADTIRDRLKIYGEIQTLTAEGRLSGYILAALPFALMLILQLINNNYLNDMISTGIGRVLLGGALLMIGVGFLVIRRLSNIQV